MIKEIGCFGFPGFYESIFCNSDEFIDDEKEIEYEIEEDLISKNFEVVYEYEDWDKYKKDVCRMFMKIYVEEIHDILPDYIIDKNSFKFDIIEDEDNIVVISPQYYNYSTDRCFCNIETNKETLEMIKEYTLKLDDAEEHIIKNFTSCDGFISFISNDIEEWKSLNIEDYEDNMLIALLDMLIVLKNGGFDEIIMSTYYEVDKYYYAIPTIHYREKDEEIAKKDIEYLKSTNFVLYS